MTERGGYRYVGGRTAVEAGPGRVRDHAGDEWTGDATILCPGAAHAGVAAPWLAAAPVRRCRLQMMQTAPLDERLTTALADGDSLRYYPAFAVPEAAGLPDQAPVAARWHAQLLVSQRAGGELTIGDTHWYEEPYDFAVEEEPYEMLRARVEALLGRSLPPVRATLGRRLLAGHRRVRVCARRTRARARDRHRPGWTWDDALAGDRPRHARNRRSASMIRLAVLDMAGTTVRDGGVVEQSFVEALARHGLRPRR